MEIPAQTNDEAEGVVDPGGHTAAVLFSLVATCERHKINPSAYLKDVLTRIAATAISQLDQLLPNHWKTDCPIK